MDTTEAAGLDLVKDTVADDKLDERVADLLSTLANQLTENLGLAKQIIQDNLGAS